MFGIFLEVVSIICFIRVLLQQVAKHQFGNESLKDALLPNYYISEG